MQKIFCLGLHKTGSTSLQRFFLDNQVALARSGMLVPPVTPEATARFIAELMGRPQGARPPRVNEYMAHNALAYQMLAEAVPAMSLPAVHAPMGSAESVLKMTATLAEQVQARSVVFCSEDLPRASLVASRVPERFARALRRRDTVLFAILRRPDEAISAWQSQRLRFGRPFAPVRNTGLAAYRGTVHLEYKAALEPWLHAFPSATVRFLPYDFALRRGGSVRAFRALDPLVFLPNGLVAPPHVNPGMPNALIEIARRGLAALPAAQARGLIHFLAGLGAVIDLPPNDEVDLLGPEMRAGLMRCFDETHHWLSQVSGRIPFFADLDDMLRPRRWSDVTAAAEMLGAVRDLARDAGLSTQVQAFLAELDRTGLGGRAPVVAGTSVGADLPGSGM